MYKLFCPSVSIAIDTMFNFGGHHDLYVHFLTEFTTVVPKNTRFSSCFVGHTKAVLKASPLSCVL